PALAALEGGGLVQADDRHLMSRLEKRVVGLLELRVLEVIAKHACNLHFPPPWFDPSSSITLRAHSPRRNTGAAAARKAAPCRTSTMVACLGAFGKAVIAK